MEALTARSDLTSLIETVSKENGINSYVITNVQTNQKGEGYLGEIFTVSVKDAKGEKQLEIVVKAAFTDAQVRAMFPIRANYENEIYFYTEVLKSFEKFGERISLQFTPKCLKTSLKEGAEVVILENLKVSGFEIFDKKLVLDHDHVRLIFETYGRYHGYSFVMRDQNPEEFRRITNGFSNIQKEYAKSEFFAQSLVQISNGVQALLIPGEDDEIIKKFEKYLGTNGVDIFADIASKETDYSGILHGDCWSNNMLFKYENSANGKIPTDMRLIDFQMIRTGSPVCDLSYCLYSGASKEIFDRLNEYLQVYHDSFSSLVKELGSDPEKLFPMSVLKEDWKKYSAYGMITALSMIRLKLTYTEDVVDLTDGLDMENFSEAFKEQKFDQEGYTKRVRELLWHMSEIDAL